MARQLDFVNLSPLLVTLAIVGLVKCSEVSQVYVLPPPSMQLQNHQNVSEAAATVQDIHVVKPPEILLRNSLLNSINANFSSIIVPQKVVHDSHEFKPVNNLPLGPIQRVPVSPIPALMPQKASEVGPIGSAPRMGHDPSTFQLPGSTPTSFPLSPFTPQSNISVAPTFNPSPDFNQVDRFMSLVPMDYENGQMPGFMAPVEKRAAQAPPPRQRPLPSRRMDNGPVRRNSTSTFKNIISTFSDRVSRIFMGPRRRAPKPMRMPPAKIPQKQPVQAYRHDLRPDHTTIPAYPPSQPFNSQAQQTPATDRSFVAALNTVAQLLQHNQYIPMMGKRERVRTLSQEESQHLDSLRRRDRKPRRRPYKLRFPRRRRPQHPRDFSPHDEDGPHHHEDDDYYPGPPKYSRPQKYYDDESHSHKDVGPYYKFKSLKSWRPWKQSFHEPSHHDDHHDDGYRSTKHSHGRKPAWHIDSHEKGGFNRYKPHHDKYKEYVQDEAHGSYKKIKPFYGGFDPTTKFTDWDEKKMKFHKVIDYDHGVISASKDHYISPKFKHGGYSAHVKDDDTKMPKIIINHHHNLPPPVPASNFMPGGFPSGSVLSYSPPINHFHQATSHPNDFFSGRGRSRDFSKSHEIADSFIVNDYGKPPLTGFGMPTSGFGTPQLTFNSPPQGGIQSNPPFGGNIGNNNNNIFDQFSQNVPSHFMPNKFAQPNFNQGPFTPNSPANGNPVSFSNTNFAKPLVGGGGHIAPGFPALGNHDGSVFPYGNPNQMASYNENSFPSNIPGNSNDNGIGPSQHEHFGPELPSPDSSPFPSTNEHHDTPGFPSFAPPPSSDVPPTESSNSPTSHESFFRHRSKVPRTFELKIVKHISSGFELGNKKRQQSEKKPNGIVDYFNLDVPDREHYKKKRKNPNHKLRESNSRSAEEHQQYFKESSGFASLENKHRFDSAEFNYSTLPENWKTFRPDPTHNKLPSFAHTDSAEGSSRVKKMRTAMSPKSFLKSIMNRIPRTRMDKVGSRGHTKFTPFDAVARSQEDASSLPERKRRKSSKRPASIQDIINSDSSNHNKEIVVAPSDDTYDELNNSNNQNAHDNDGGASAPVAVVVGKGQRKTRGSLRDHVSNEMQTEVPFNGEIDDDVLLGVHSQQNHLIMNIPVAAEMRIGEVAEDIKKKK